MNTKFKNKFKTLLGTILLTLPFIFGLNTEAFLNGEPTETEVSELLYIIEEEAKEQNKYIIGCINKYTLDYVAFEEPKRASANPCFIGTGYENVFYNSNEFWELRNDLGYDLTDTLDLLTIRTLECKESSGYCVGGGVDFGPFQLNSIHTDEVEYSKELMYSGKRLDLFKYQAQWTYFSKLYGTSYYKWCTPYTNTREGLSKCRFKLHNGNNKSVGGRKYKDIYADAGWVIREKILKPYIKNNEFIGQS